MTLKRKASGFLYFYYSRNIVDTNDRAVYGLFMKLIDAAAQLEALGNPTRLSIFRTLVRAGEAGLSVGRLQQKIGAAASTLSHHLQKLIQVGLVHQERNGTTLICRANYHEMQGLVGFLVDQCCADVTEINAA
jgi:DNA-binding transcriptional ArsR family regulator